MNKTDAFAARPGPLPYSGLARAQVPRPTRGEYSFTAGRSRPAVQKPRGAVQKARDAADGEIPDAMVTEQLRLFGWVGSSGKATVWLAEHMGLEIPVVVKLLPPELARKPEALESFRREATVLARLRTPHVVQVLDQGMAASGSAYIVMELLEGLTVEAALRRPGAVTLPDAIEILRQTGRVLAKARDLGIRCKNIEPHKVFLVDGEIGPFVKLTDFAAEDGSSDKLDATNIGALANLAWRCLASSPTMPVPIEDWLAHAAAPPGETPFQSVRELLAALDDAVDRATREGSDEPVESGEVPVTDRGPSSGPSTEEVDATWPT